MTIDKAIRIGTNYLKGSDEAEPLEFDKFIKLGIEALYIIQQARKGNYLSIQQPLPSETPSPANSLSEEELKRLQESPRGEK